MKKQGFFTKRRGLMIFFRLLIFASVLLLPILGSASVSTLVADTKSGLILASKNATQQQYPASLTKVMTLYLTFSAIDKGILKMDDRLPVSLKAARQPRSKLYVRAGQTISVRDAIMALIIISANDVAVVLAEALAPSEEEFAQIMTKTARSLGLKSTTFKNASGLHNPDQVTTAQDMAVLAMAMIHHFPHHYKLFSKRSFTYKGRTYRSHNHVQKKYKGAEGLKTGYISAVGYNIISTAKRNNNRLVSVVIGQDTVALRDKQAMNLLDKGFSKIKKHNTIHNGQNLLSKKAIITKPDMLPHLKVMAKRLDKVVKSKTPVNRSRLLALNPFGIKEAQAAEQEITTTAQNQNIVQEQDSLIEQGSNMVAEAEAEALEDKKEEENTPTEDISETPLDQQNKTLTTVQPVKQEEDLIQHDSPSEDKSLIQNTTSQNETPVEEIVAEGIVNTISNDTNPIDKTSANTPEKEQSESSNQHEKPIVSVNQFADTSKESKKETTNGFGIQVGAFNTEEIAKQQAAKALKLLNIRNKQILTPQSGIFYRARIYGFYSKKAAQNACRKLKQKTMACMPLTKNK